MDLITSISNPNIALIKYWGKNYRQTPSNPSISFRLKKCYSKTKLFYKKRKNYKEEISIKVFEKGIEKNNNLYYTIKSFINDILPYCNYLNKFDLFFYIKTNFPYGVGLAYSSSLISSICLCIIKLEYNIKGINYKKSNFFLKKVSLLSRIGSGSACRSIYPGFVIWGKKKNIKNSSNYYAIPYNKKIHNIYKKLQNTILIIDNKKKIISSSEGHILMKKNPYSKTKFLLSNKNLDNLFKFLENGDFKNFGNIIEYEALNLHAMMMCSIPYYMLIKPNTLEIIYKIWNFRKKNNILIYFTLDAGPNIHVIYPYSEKKKILLFIKNELIIFCKKIIKDEISY
ncbi:diphosphomevalonate/mevalonate 3,5-bisphosphate decarboxylase family protein [Candidatus Shikimatogenerans silvanidophilus]|uniref:diphosphomevalonate/mevalonate 3,5-bisphosphate decarboxylase family protein n=1 Tax=Candidatus Shikimatogenerans silvanidophilus TaxID=2782547 RepID=UPI001BAACFBA|nr:diphosphomevalonate decarboxylase [Candidatus Shikimatogenerans silvanidophilus]